MDLKLITPVLKLKEAMLRDLLRDKDKLDEPYVSIALLTGGSGQKTSWTRRELAEEIKNDTDMAADMMIQLIKLTTDLLQRNKI